MKRSAVNMVMALALVGFGLGAAPALAQDPEAAADAPAADAPAADAPADETPRPATREGGQVGPAAAPAEGGDSSVDEAPKPATREAGKQGGVEDGPLGSPFPASPLGLAPVSEAPEPLVPEAPLAEAPVPAEGPVSEVRIVGLKRVEDAALLAAIVHA